MTELEAKLVQPVEYSKFNQLQEQVALNLNNPEYSTISDISFDRQDQLVKPKIDAFEEPVETGWKRIKRRQFIFPTRRERNVSAKIARGQMSRQMQKFSTDNSVELIRKANAVNNFVENLFNTRFSGQDPSPAQTIAG